MDIKLKTLFAAALFAQIVNAVAAPKTVCPDRHTDGRRFGPLDNASVFDGPPGRRLGRMPDPASATWDIAADQESSRQRGESMYLVCHYKRIDASVTLKIPPDATFCKVAAIKESTRVYCGNVRQEADPTPQ